MKKETKEELKTRLTKTQWKVTQEDATERPYTNEFNAHFQKGIYVDIIDGTPLFISTKKYDSHCGWPAFSKPIDNKLIVNIKDNSYGMERIAIKSKNTDSHLGHVFNDGPKEDGGLRYCINSASLKFVPFENMDAKGYSKYKKLV